jgi:hypothetical protein
MPGVLVRSDHIDATAIASASDNIPDVAVRQTAARSRAGAEVSSSRRRRANSISLYAAASGRSGLARRLPRRDADSTSRALVPKRRSASSAKPPAITVDQPLNGLRCALESTGDGGTVLVCLQDPSLDVLDVLAVLHVAHRRAHAPRHSGARRGGRRLRSGQGDFHRRRLGRRRVRLRASMKLVISRRSAST